MSRRLSFFSNSSNPTLSKKRMAEAANQAAAGGEVMTLNGTINKTLILLGLTFLSAMASWTLILNGTLPFQATAMIGGIGGLVLALIISFKPERSPMLAPIYAILEGAMLGAISLAMVYVADGYVGIVFQAIVLTFATMFVMLLIYKNKIIRVTPKFRKMVIMAMGAIFLLYMTNFVLGLFGTSVPYLHESGPIGIGISIVVIVVASLMLLVDFDMIERFIENKAPAYFEWFGGFALLVTLIWLYIEFLRLLAIFSSGD